MRFVAALLLGILAGTGPAQETQDSPKVTIQARIEPAKVPAGGSATLVVDVTVAPGWHVYGAREEQFGEPIGLQLLQPTTFEPAGAARIPPGEVHVDAGMTMYWLTGTFSLRQPILVPEGLGPGKHEVAARVSWTACDDSVCLPPDSQRVRATLEVGAAEARQDPPAPDPDARVSFDVRVEPLEVAPGGTVRVVVRTTVVPDWHVYGANEHELGEPIKLTVADPAGLTAEGPPRIPPGIQVTESGVTTWQLRHEFDLVQFLRVPDDAEPGQRELTLKVDYTACDDSHCLPVASEQLRATVTVARGGGTATPEPAADLQGGLGQVPGSNLLQFLILAILGGLLALVMPCTYPMIPITISFFTKQADARGGRVLPLALAYGAGIVLVFVLIGVFAGGVITEFAVHPVTNLLIGLLFILFALALFGVIDLQPPRFLLNMAGKASTRGGYAGVFLMGTTLVVTSFTCTTPFVGTVLAIAPGNVGYAVAGMAVFGLTMAVPFVWLALAPGWIRAMPRSGEWMHTVKVFLGFVEVAAALKFLSNVDLVYNTPDLWLPRELFLLLWAAIFFVAGLYLLGTFRLRDEGQTEIGPGRMVGALATILFAAYCAYGAMGHRLDSHVMTPLAPPQFAMAELRQRGTVDGGPSLAEHAAAHEIVIDDFDAAKSRAAAAGRLLLVNFTGVT